MRGFLLFVVYVIAEFAVAAWIASMAGWLLVIGLTFAGFVLGLIVIQNASMKTGAVLRQAGQGSNLDTDQIADAGIMFVAGGLIIIPGFITDVVGLLILIPPIRRATRRFGRAAFSRWVRRRGMSVVTTTVNGETVTRVVPGDVIVGDVIRHDDDPSSGPTRPYNEGPPPELPPR